ncbi:MAG TPA: GNAT family N-acetyltransferase [Caulobacteraceae bacterium]|nr:GNAT family N-acetyltransferase [Caulobacteraceae bacterium]
MRIRDATPADLPGVLAIYNDIIATSTAIYTSEPTTLAERTAWWEMRRARGYPLIVAADRDEIFAFGSFGDWRTSPGYVSTVEHTVHVRADCRRRGLGRAIVTDLIERARALGKHVMLGGIDADNSASLALHEGLGFERAALHRQVARKFDRWLDLVFVQRLL